MSARAEEMLLRQAVEVGAVSANGNDKSSVSTEDKEIVSSEGIRLPDMPETVLDGRLGEICQERFADCPVAYAWPALLAAGSATVNEQDQRSIRTNIYACPVGPVHSGKTSVIERAFYQLEILPPLLVTLKAGSAEGLLAKIGDQQGKGCLLYPDELSHMLEKAQIQNASFCYILNSLFYKNEEELTIARGKPVHFNCRLSIVGGIVDDKFEDSFGSATTAGLYDRFLFGVCPTGYEYLWRPVEGAPAVKDTFDEVPVNIDVWEARDEMARSEKINPRILEISLRCAAICAAIDRRDRLRAKDLGPAWELARYQERVRLLLQPNGGKNFEAKIALKILAYLNRHAGAEKWMVLRQVLREIHAYEMGPSVCERAIQAMRFGGAIEEDIQIVGRGQKQRIIRLPGESHA